MNWVLVTMVFVFVVVSLAAYHLLGRLATERFEQHAEKAKTIFVSIASYRDAACSRTLRELFENAARPDRVFVGVCEQNTAAAEEGCLPPGFRWHDHVRRVSVPAREAKGPTYARHLCSTLYRGEAYFCQLDSHMRFVKNWDEECIAMLKTCVPSKQGRKPVLTHYPHDVPRDGEVPDGVSDGVPVLCKSKFDHQGIVTFDSVTLPASRIPRMVPFTAGGFLFGPGSMVQEVPFDPDLPHLFQGEEFLYSARLWTHGYDFFTPTRNVVFHEYYRKSAPKFWDDIEYAVIQQKTMRKVLRLLDPDSTTDKAGQFGTVRSLREYYEFAGVDWAGKKTSSEGRFCV